MALPTGVSRLVLAATAFSAWMVALFSGYSLGGAIHLLLLVGLALFPWRSLLETIR